MYNYSVHVSILTSPKAVLFVGHSSTDLCGWLESIGLPMYSDLVLDKHVTGEKLAEMVAVPTNQHLVVSHCVCVCLFILITHIYTP